MNNPKTVFNTYFFCFIYWAWVFFIHICGSQYFTLFDVEALIKYFNAGILAFLLVYFILSYKVNRNLFFDCLITFVFFIGYIYFKKGVLIFFFILMCRHVPFTYIVKTFLLASLVGMIFIYITYLFDLYPETYLNLFRADGNFRYLLGYRFPTFLPNYYFHIVLCWFFLRKEKITFVEFFIILLVNIPIYLLTDTRAVFYLVILATMSVMFIKYFKINYSTLIFGRTFSFLTKYSFMIFGFIAIYFQYNYDRSIEWMGKLNTIFSGRLALGHWGFELYGIKPFGNLVNFVPMLEANNENKFFYIDSAYVQLLLVYGAIIFALIMFAYIKIGAEIYKRNEKYFGIALIFLFIHSMTDPQLMSPEFNPFILCLGYYGLGKYKNNLFK